MDKIKLGLSFDDVLLVPKKGIVSTRKDVSLKSKLTSNIALNVPIVSANMDTVTEAKMAIAMARLGGIGFIHRFLTVEEQFEQVLKVKRSEGILIENPYTLSQDNTIKEARGFMSLHGINALIIVDKDNLVEGILTSRDLVFEESLDKKIGEVMTPKNKLITAEYGISLVNAKNILRKNKIEKLPLVDRNFKLKGLITSSDIKKRDKYPNSSKDKKGRLRVGAAVGVKGDFLDRTESLVAAGTDIIVVDVAHGHSNLAMKTTRKIKSKFDVDVVAGNVCTKQGVKDLIKSGADCIKVGVGPGAYCTTRIVTGCGVPQITAIRECSKSAGKIPVIADGGIKNSGDISKAIAAGSNTVMVGNLLAGTDESPGITLFRDGSKVKVGRGMASLGANIHKTKDYEEYVAEGVESLIPYRGSVLEVINQLVGGLKSGVSYNGSKDLSGLRRNSEFIRITKEGMRESKPHDIGI
jgi:IMP dehydrogenase